MLRFSCLFSSHVSPAQGLRHLGHRRSLTRPFAHIAQRRIAERSSRHFSSRSELPVDQDSDMLEEFLPGESGRTPANSPTPRAFEQEIPSHSPMNLQEFSRLANQDIEVDSAASVRAQETKESLLNFSPDSGAPCETPLCQTEADGGSRSEASILHYENMSLKEILQKSQKFGSNSFYLLDSDRVLAACEVMNQLGLPAVLVFNGVNQLVGIFTPRDLVKKMSDSPQDPRRAPLKDFMSESVVFAWDSDGAMECLSQMNKFHIQELPVKSQDNEAVIGIITMADLVAALAGNFRESTIHLKEYVAGKYSK